MFTTRKYSDIARHADRLDCFNGTLGNLIEAMTNEASTLHGDQLELRRQYVNRLHELSDEPYSVPISFFVQR